MQLAELRDRIYPLAKERNAYIFGSLSPSGAPAPVVVGTLGEIPVTRSKSVTRPASPLPGSLRLSTTWPSGVYQSSGAKFKYTEWGRTVADWTFDIMAFRIDKMPPEMKSKVRATMLAEPSEWPCDSGVRNVVRQIRQGLDATKPEKLLLARSIEEFSSSAPPPGGGDETGAGVGTAVAVVGGLGVAGLIAWALLK